MKETLYKDSLIASRNGDGKIMQPIWITSGFPLGSRFTSAKVNIRQSNTHILKLATFQRWAKGARKAAREGPTVQHMFL